MSCRSDCDWFILLYSLKPQPIILESVNHRGAKVICSQFKALDKDTDCYQLQIENNFCN